MCKLKAVTVLVEKPQAVTVLRLLVMVDSLAASTAGAEDEEPAGATSRLAANLKTDSTPKLRRR
jgi:hypothetical protein